MIYYIYRAKNKNTDKCYIGVSYKPIHRIKQHHRDSRPNKSNYQFHNALRKYEEAFEWEILHYHTDKDEAYEDERWWIKRFDTFHSGYNMTEGGENPSHSEESNRKRSESMLGKNKGRKLGPHSEESNRKRSATLKGHRAWNKGVPATEERKKKQSEAMKGKTHGFQKGYTPWNKGKKQLLESIK